MALFVIERSFAEQLQLDQEGIDVTQAYNEDANLRWLFSFLSADKKKTYCLYEAPDAGALFQQAKDLGIPADAVIEVSEVNPQMFVAWSQAPEPQVSMVVRTAVDPTTLVDAMHRDIWAVDPSLPVEEWTLAELMDTSLEGSKFQTTLLVSFATVALILAAMGVYALVSYAVTQRTREIGVRMALGAARSDVVTMVLRQGARLTIAGVALGLLNAFFLTRVMRRVLYDVSPSDPLVHTLAAVLLGVVAVIATYIPARRAATVDPVVALRDER